MVKQKAAKAGFCTWSACFDLQFVPLAVERECHPMSPLCVHRDHTGTTLLGQAEVGACI